MYDIDLQEVLDKVSIFDKIYEILRLVDPIQKKVVSYKNNIISDLDGSCFDFWGKNLMCNNCVSIRAYYENKTFVKIEYSEERIFVITAIPIELNNRRIVIELLKDNTDSLIFTGIEGQSSNRSEIYTMIDYMNNLVMKDELTGIYNRRYINEKLPVDLLEASLLEQSLSIIIADIDFFKKVNDVYGHLVGDCALKSFVNILKECLQRKSDWIARYGGEEFLICIPGADLDRTLEIAELMRKSVEETEINCKEDTFKITASFGVYNAIPKKGDTIEIFIGQADTKLYLAKDNGRNRVEY